MKYFKNRILEIIYLQRIENLLNRWMKVKLELQLGIDSLRFLSSQFTHFKNKEYVEECLRSMKRVNEVLGLVLHDLGKKLREAKKAGLQERKEILKYMQENLKELEEWKKKRN